MKIGCTFFRYRVELLTLLCYTVYKYTYALIDLERERICWNF